MKILLLPLVLLLGYVAKPAAPIQLKGYFLCRTSLLEGPGDALSCYARTQRDCRSGDVVLAFEKRRSARTAKPVFEITDTVHVKLVGPARTLEIARCTLANGKSRQYFVLIKAAAGSKKYLQNVERAWGVNEQSQLVAVPVKTVRCLNEDDGAN